MFICMSIYINLQISNLIPNNLEEKIAGIIREAKRPLKSGEIAEMSGLDKKEVERAIKKLVASGEVYSPKRCFYDLKK